MPVDYSRYPDNWKEIRQQVLEREDHKCKWCGIENYAIGARNLLGQFISVRTIQNHMEVDDFFIHQFGSTDYPRTFKIVLTIAHIGVPKFPCDTGDKHDKMDCRLINLAALCQKCHLTFDIDEHIDNRRKTLARKKRERIAATGQLSLFTESEVNNE